MQQPRWTWSTLIIVAATVALVFGPVLIPREVARWYLAAAANAYRVGDREQGQQYLERAVRWDASVMSDGDFWIAQMGSTRSQTADETLDLLEKAIKTDPSRAGMAFDVAEMLIGEFDFQRAVRAMKLGFQDGQPRTPEGLNLLAYLRAQAGIELEQALKDIEQAIESAGKDPAMLDTKAWVLHAEHRDLEALAILNEAIAKLEKKMGKSKTEPSAKTQAKENGEASATAGRAKAASRSEQPLSRTAEIRQRIQAAKVRLGPELWSLAVMRFHRLRIYEALRQPVEARQERQWLLEQDVPIVDELF